MRKFIWESFCWKSTLCFIACRLLNFGEARLTIGYVLWPRPFSSLYNGGVTCVVYLPLIFRVLSSCQYYLHIILALYRVVRVPINHVHYYRNGFCIVCILFIIQFNYPSLRCTQKNVLAVSLLISDLPRGRKISTVVWSSTDILYWALSAWRRGAIVLW